MKYTLKNKTFGLLAVGVLSVGVATTALAQMVRESDLKEIPFSDLSERDMEQQFGADFVQAYRTFKAETDQDDIKVSMGRTDVNGDGRSDYVLSYEGTFSCGTMGCPMRVYINSGNSFTPNLFEATDAQAVLDVIALNIFTLGHQKTGGLRDIVVLQGPQYVYTRMIGQDGTYTEGGEVHVKQ